MDPVSGELWIANSYMNCIDRFTPQGDFIARRFLWEISPAIDKLAQTRNRQAADLCHLNYFDSIGTDRVAMLGNLNGTGKGASCCSKALAGLMMAFGMKTIFSQQNKSLSAFAVQEHRQSRRYPQLSPTGH